MALCSKKIQSRKRPSRIYNFDAQLLGQYWACFPGLPRIYHHTVSSTLLLGLREAIASFIQAGGLEISWQRHATMAKRLADGLQAGRLEMFIKDADLRAPSVTAVNVPEGIDAAKVVAFMMQKYRLEIGGGLGPTAGRIFRIGLMGGNATEANVDFVIRALLEAVDAVKRERVASKM